MRPSEAAGTRWDEIDIENALWHIPSERMKKKTFHTVPLSPQCLQLPGVGVTMQTATGNMSLTGRKSLELVGDRLNQVNSQLDKPAKTPIMGARDR